MHALPGSRDGGGGRAVIAPGGMHLLALTSLPSRCTREIAETLLVAKIFADYRRQ
jgi:hypothetical protein